MALINCKKKDKKKSKEMKITEKCIFCQEEYLRETLCEVVGQEKSDILQVSICQDPVFDMKQLL